MQFYVEFGRLVRTTRNGAGLTQMELATRAGIGRASLANIEAGRQRVTLDVFLALSAALGVAPTDLLPTSATAPITSDETGMLRGLDAKHAAWVTKVIGSERRPTPDEGDDNGQG